MTASDIMHPEDAALQMLKKIPFIDRRMSFNTESWV